MLSYQNIVKRTASKTKDEAQAIKAMKLLEKVRLHFMFLKICSHVIHISALEFLISYLSFSLLLLSHALQMIQESNESISQMKNIESLVTLNAKVDFECRVSITRYSTSFVLNAI